MARSKGYVVVAKDKTGKLSSYNCADLEAVENQLDLLQINPEEVFVFTSQPVEIRRAITIEKAPRKPKAKANGAKPVAKPPTAPAPAA